MSEDDIKALCQHFMAAKRAADTAVHDEVAAKADMEKARTDRDAAIEKMNAAASGEPVAFAWYQVKSAGEKEAAYRDSLAVFETAIAAVGPAKKAEAETWERLVNACR